MCVCVCLISSEYHLVLVYIDIETLFFAPENHNLYYFIIGVSILCIDGGDILNL